MPLLSALIWAACGAGAEAVVIKKYIMPNETLSKTIYWSFVVSAASVSAVGGWFSMMRNAIPDQLRMLLIMLVLCGAATVDLRSRKIPNGLSLVLLAGFIAFTILDFLVRRQQAMAILVTGLLGGTVILAFLGLCRLLTRGGVGMGDVKLLTCTALILGIHGGICTLLYSQLLALVVAIVLLIARKATMKDSLPFAPIFCAGFLLCLILGTY